MRQIREILRQVHLGRSHREIAASLGIGVATVHAVKKRARSAGFTYEKLGEISDTDLELKLYGAPQSSRNAAEPDCAYIHLERQKKGVTLELLHLEYLEQNPTGLKYTTFCDRYRSWLKKQRLSMHQAHQAGEKCFIDYSGSKPYFIEPLTGEKKEVELFVAVMGASNYTYAEASPSQKLPDFIASHRAAFEFFNAVPKLLVPDQLKSAATVSGRYEVESPRVYVELASHYGTAVLPARPRKPKDKAKVEVAVQIVQRWVLARLRKQTFFSLAELNQRIFELVVELNKRIMKRYKASREELFNRLDKPAMGPLPSSPFAYADWKYAKVNIDYHVELEKHRYSVPFRHVGETVELRFTNTTVEVFRQRERIAVHRRNNHPGGYSTEQEHMPASHRAHAQWTPERLLSWCARIGPHTRDLVEGLLSRKAHPEIGYRAVLGLMALSKKYGNSQLENASARAVSVGAYTYRSVSLILKKGLDSVPLESPVTTSNHVVHANIRGPAYYH